ncbi:5246_t:CDS:2, partial [Acaulospora morrowiae]
MFDNETILGKILNGTNIEDILNNKSLRIHIGIKNADKFHNHMEIRFKVTSKDYSVMDKNSEWKTIQFYNIQNTCYNIQNTCYINDLDKDLDDLILFIKVKDKVAKYDLKGIKFGMSVQTHELLEGIILTLAIVDGDDESPGFKSIYGSTFDDIIID